eukprot:CAMPEP_0197850984 /NCGR_PEP_ID=MMETSP1438-20131217/16933_1 /TAXON_ID=1461541 /ORGANISM="Pterosperma sp., Strain CCMP1384" /LENGTH=297 /DNA_ID=CAMNT_0043464431 /DNA_START=214 /DNA_END=1107 /DNA_ORIENTATION=+
MPSLQASFSPRISSSTGRLPGRTITRYNTSVITKPLKSSKLILATASAAATDTDVAKIKDRMLKIAALTDRGQRHNPVVSAAYREKEDDMRRLVGVLSEEPHTVTEESISGEWELVYSTCELFRSSPFFMAIEEAFNNQDKSDLFFRLHQLQVLSWGASTVGRVAQRIDFRSEILESDFDTILFGSTVIPIIGWFKLLPTFGGRIVTQAKDLKLEGTTLHMELDRTTFREVEGVSPGILGRVFMDKWAPTNAVWKLLPWNWSSGAPTASCVVVYVDDDMRIMKDLYGQYFVYTRPMN